MPYDQVAESCIRVTDGLRELLTMMHFPEIPKEATYLAFFEDGECIFMKGEIKKESPLQFELPHFLFVTTSVLKNVLVQDIED
jgi:hypothetical protein